MTFANLWGIVIALLAWSGFVAWRLAILENHIRRLRRILDSHGIYE